LRVDGGRKSRKRNNSIRSSRKRRSVAREQTGAQARAEHDLRQIHVFVWPEMVATLIYISFDGFLTTLIAIKMEKTGGAGLLPCRVCPLWYCKQCQVAETNILFMYLILFWFLMYMATNRIIKMMKKE